VNGGIIVEIQKGSNILDCVRKVFSIADQSGIKLRESYLSLAELIRDTESVSIKNGIIASNIAVGINSDGTVLVKKSDE
jgi:transcriptional regulator